ncbi:MAG: cob(I)yrinic acid a,c-diamide adenosyltransferase [Odoribacter splanchnicus]
METKGYLQVYTGNGKGKTTAAFGLAVRALCAGKRVFIGQFAKSMKYNETRLKACFPGRLAVRQFGRGCFLDHRPEDVRLAQEGLRECAVILASGEWDLVILDELTIAVYFGLLSDEEILEVIGQRDTGTEVVITRRYASEALLALADLVTEMREVKHYYTRGVVSRDGFDH